MKRRIQCFFLEPTNRAQVTLRRYRDSVRYLRNPDGTFKIEKRGDKEVLLRDPNFDGICKKGNYCCDAQIDFGECDASDRHVSVTEDMKKDSNWPKACECGYVFQDEDHWQWNENTLYLRKDTGEHYILGRAPAGAMWYADWMNIEGYAVPGPDGHILCVNTPDGHWVVDGRATNDPKIPGWTRSGMPPNVTANPSIICGSYHGWLRNGWLEEV
jgi:hypothetical protein